MAATAMAAGALAGLQIMQGFQQAEMIERGAQMTQQINEMNAKYAEIDAYEAEKFGYEQAAQYQSEIDATVGAQRVAMAASGVDVTYGTAAEIQAEARLTGFLNQVDIKNAANARARGLKLEASNLRLGSVMGRLQAGVSASATRAAGFLNAGTTGLSAMPRGSSGMEVGGSPSKSSDSPTGYNKGK